MSRLRRLAPTVAALSMLAGAVWLAHVEIFRAGAAQFAPLDREGAVIDRVIAGVDVTFEAWLVARHARTLWTHPWDLLDTEHCAPERHSITYGVPLIALGVLGMPAALFSREPVFIYNAALAAWSAVAALSMYLLVTGWTGRRAAGVAAALLFAFHPIRIAHVVHPAEWDIAWTALALFFAERLFAQGRWRDAIGLGAAGAMQVAASFYTLVAASLLALPLGLWLLLRRAPRKASLAQLAVAVAIVALAAAIVLGPYLAARHEEQIIGRIDAAVYGEWARYGPGADLYLGWPLILLALAGLLVPRRLALARVAGDPRPVLLAGALLVAFVAAGPSTAALLQGLHLPVPAFDPWAALARVVPGLDTVRGVLRLGTAVHLVACVLAGAGFAAAIALAGRYGPAVSASALALGVFACFGFPRPSPLRWQLEPVRPAQATIDFFDALEAEGNTGPMLELPVDFRADDSTYPGPRRILLSFWHGRRTSACFGSFLPPSRTKIIAQEGALPAKPALDALRDLGFTTLVMHHEVWLIKALSEKKYAHAIRPGGGLRLVHESEMASAWEILPARPAGAEER
jgi:hypothetical protein